MAKSNFNRGDVSEGILAAAIAARFISKTKRITPQQVMDLIGDLNKAKAARGEKGLTTITEFPSPNENPKIIDRVICKVNLAEVNMAGFQRKATYRDKDIRLLVSSAVDYANGRYIREWADKLYKNNQKNTIEVNSEGLLDQRNSKVDLKVIVDGKLCGVGVSLKAGAVPQFGQVGGSKWESMENLFNPLGVNFSRAVEQQYTELLAEKKLAPALTLAYTEAFKQIVKQKQEDLRKNIANFADYHATLDQENVVLVQLAGGSATVYNFSLLKEKLKGINVTAQLSSGTTTKLQGYKGGSKIPKIMFYTPGTSNRKIPLLQVRLKLEGNRTSSKGERLPLVVRNYIEKGKAMKDLIGNQ